MASNYADITFSFELQNWNVYHSLNTTNGKACSIWRLKYDQLCASFPQDQMNKYVIEMSSRLSAIRKFSHVNILKIYDVSEPNSTFFFTSEPVTGGFNNVLPLSQDESLYVTAQMIEVLRHIHNDLNFAYLDLSPENVVFTQDLTLKLYNFLFMTAAISHLLPVIPAVSPHANSPFDTPFSYSSPELISGSYLSKQTDIFQFALISIQAFTNLPCLTARSLATYDVKQAQGSATHFKVPAALMQLFQRCLSEDPKDRPTSANLAVDANIFTVQMKVLFYLPQLPLKSIDERSRFYSNLPSIITDFSPKLLSCVIIPDIVADISDDFRSGVLFPIVMPVLLLACSKLPMEQLHSLVLYPLITAPNSRECARYLLGNIFKLTDKIPQADQSRFIVGLSVVCLSSDIPGLRARAADMLCRHVKNLDFDLITNSIYPQLIEHFKTSQDTDFIVSVLKCFSAMVTVMGHQRSLLVFLPSFYDAIRQFPIPAVAETVCDFVHEFGLIDLKTGLKLSSLCIEALMIEDADISVQNKLLEFAEGEITSLRNERNIPLQTIQSPHDVHKPNPFILSLEKSASASKFNTLKSESSSQMRRRGQSFRENASFDPFGTLTPKPFSPLAADPFGPPQIVQNKEPVPTTTMTQPPRLNSPTRNRVSSMQLPKSFDPWSTTAH